MWHKFLMEPIIGKNGNWKRSNTGKFHRMAHSFLTWIGKALTIEHYPHTFRFNGRYQSSEHNREGTYIWNEQFLVFLQFPIELIEQITEFPSQRVLFLSHITSLSPYCKFHKKIEILFCKQKSEIS